jgi:hypothetical protein
MGNNQQTHAFSGDILMRRRLYALPAFLLLAACTTIKVDHDYDPGADFTGYSTFAWVSSKPLLLAGQFVNPALEGHLMSATEAALKGKGFRRVRDPEQADFNIAFFLGSADKIRATSYPQRYRYGTAQRQDAGWRWGAAQHDEVRSFTKGTLTIDILDVATHQPAWRGWSARTITGSDQANPEALMRQIVSAILEPFPPG